MITYNEGKQVTLPLRNIRAWDRFPSRGEIQEVTSDSIPLDRHWITPVSSHDHSDPLKFPCDFHAITHYSLTYTACILDLVPTQSIHISYPIFISSSNLILPSVFLTFWPHSATSLNLLKRQELIHNRTKLLFVGYSHFLKTRQETPSMTTTILNQDSWTHKAAVWETWHF